MYKVSYITLFPKPNWVQVGEFATRAEAEKEAQKYQYSIVAAPTGHIVGGRNV